MADMDGTATRGGLPSQRAAIAKVHHRKDPRVRIMVRVRDRVRVRDGVRDRVRVLVSDRVRVRIFVMADLCDGGPLQWRTGTLLHSE